MKHLLNFRDFGGDLTASGGRVRRGVLFRSGHMGGLPAEAEQDLIKQRFALVVDLRYADERVTEPTPNALLPVILANDELHESDAPHIAVIREAINGAGSLDAAYHHLYSGIPFDLGYRSLFGRAVVAIAHADGPVLIHCTAGKDRTGMLSATLLAALGVPDPAIVADYLQTNGAPGIDRLRDQVVARFAGRDLATDPETLEALLGVKPEFIAVTLAMMRQEFGSVDNYLLASGVTEADLATLRTRYVATGV